MRDEGNRTYLTGNGQVVPGIVGAECRDADGVIRLYDSEGYSVPIPPDRYFPDPEWPQPEEGSLSVANAALQAVLRAAREVVWSACADFDQDEHIPGHTDHAIAVLDDALTHLETLADCPDPDPVLTHAMREGFPNRLPWHVARDNGLMGPRREDGR